MPLIPRLGKQRHLLNPANLIHIVSSRSVRVTWGDVSKHTNIQRVLCYIMKPDAHIHIHL